MFECQRERVPSRCWVSVSEYAYLCVVLSVCSLASAGSGDRVLGASTGVMGSTWRDEVSDGAVHWASETAPERAGERGAGTG